MLSDNINNELDLEEEHAVEDSDGRSMSMALREGKKAIGYKNGQVRLIEHDANVSSSSDNTDYHPRFSYLEDPNLEINQI